MRQIVVRTEFDLEIPEIHILRKRTVIAAAEISSLVKNGIVSCRKPFSECRSRLLTEEIEAVKLAVQIHIRIGTDRRICIQIVHCIVAENIAHAGRIGIHIVHAELCQAVIILILVILIHFDAEAVFIALCLIDELIGAVSLCTDADIRIGFPVDYNITGIIFLVLGMC